MQARAIENDYAAARSRERELNADLARQKLEVQSLNGKAVEYTALEREATSTVRSSTGWYSAQGKPR
jgi:uncharacterized protein involved in exopolysaccharide biosynthesis